jgi:hypothetical protein
MFNEASNNNGYPPYPGITPLREVVATDLLARLGFARQDIKSLREQGILAEGEPLSELISIAAGSVGCSGSIFAHIRYLQQKTQNSSIAVALDRVHYWKHQGVAADFGIVKVYDFTSLHNGRLFLDASEALRFGHDGGGVLVVNFANPLAFCPSAEEAESFVRTVAEWNAANPCSIISAVVDGPYDDFDGPAGYRFTSKLLSHGVPTSYVHARAKEEFGTGSRAGEVLTNVPAIRQLFNGYKADYIGSDSKLEMQTAVELHRSLGARDAQKSANRALVVARKEFFWARLNARPALASVVRDTLPFYRPDGPFYVFLNVQSVIGETPGHYHDSLAVCEAFARQGVILIPGVLFDLDPAHATGLNKVGVRVSFGSFSATSWKAQVSKVSLKQ